MVRDSQRHGLVSDRLRRRTFLATAGAGATALAFGVPSASADDGSSLPRLRTDGRWIETVDGDPVRLRGVAPADPGFYELYHPKSATEVLEWATDPDRGWHPNCVRLPLTTHSIGEFGGPEPFVEEVVRPAVDLLGERGIYAMVDFHIIRPYTQAATDDYNEDADPEDELEPIDDVMEDVWEVVAPEFADDDHVVYELFNEPTYPTTWGEYGENVDTREESWLLWRDAAQPWVDLVQDHAPDTPVIVGSPSWTSETQFAPEHPFEGENLIYASHIYPDNGQPEEFDHEYGEPAEDVPVVCTEFGWDPTTGDHYQGTNSGWGDPFREWVESYGNMGWIAWCFDDSWGPAMFDSPEAEGNEPWELKDGPEQHGGFVKTWLAEAAGEDDENGNGENGNGENGDDPDDLVAEQSPSTTSASVGEWITFQVEDTSGDDRWIVSLEWEFGDGATASGWWTQHSYDEPGTYTVGLIATDNDGRSTTHEVSVVVS
ncbi:cellulase family glycosylhydrolase [Natrarchaeobius sp. A-rgal3]|uniref:cellulase family glycosylhydrolase n=1 Tax=Natrarchaeobius versutus TaxID=1679078 RepID=UPI00350F4121